MCAYEFTEPPERAPETKPAPAGGPPEPPPRPPKVTARDLAEPDQPGKRIQLPDRIELKELAGLLGLKPFKVVGDLIAMGHFAHVTDQIDFRMAATVAKKHGLVAERSV